MGRVYELCLLFDVQANDADTSKTIDEIHVIIKDTGGTPMVLEPIGIRPLAYPIKNRTRGDYRLVRFESAPETLLRLDRMLKLREDVLRFLITKYYEWKLPPPPSKTRPRAESQSAAPAAVAPDESDVEANHGQPQ